MRTGRGPFGRTATLAKYCTTNGKWKDEVEKRKQFQDKGKDERERA